MAFNLNLDIGDKINLMSSAFVSTPFGGFPNKKLISYLVYSELAFTSLIKTLSF